MAKDTSKQEPDRGPDQNRFVEEVEVSGHIIDSLILPKVLDLITQGGGSFELKEMSIGQRRADPSYALISVEAESDEQLREILASISDHGAVPTDAQDCRLETADVDGAFPESFYSSTNQRTQVKIGGEWIDVADQEMDCGIVLDAGEPSGKPGGSPLPRCIPMVAVQRGDQVVVGHRGVRVFPVERSTQRHGFEFMNSAVSTEKPKKVAVRQVASEMLRCKREGKKVLLVGGPAIIHTGSSGMVASLIRAGLVHRLFAGNALAAHDIEQSLFGTSLGVDIGQGSIVEAGHEHHLRAINRIRRLGSIAAAVEQGQLKSGIMYECVKADVPFLLAGSIRDDGPLPDVITDALVAQQMMREQIRDVSFCLMIATTLHSIAVGNLLPAWVTVVCVDINPSTVIKLSDRGSFQTVGIVTDVEPFISSLLAELRASGEAV